MPDDNNFRSPVEEFRAFLDHKKRRMLNIVKKMHLPTHTGHAEVISDIVKEAWDEFNRHFNGDGNLNEAYDFVERSQRNLEQEVSTTTEWQ